MKRRERKLNGRKKKSLKMSKKLILKWREELKKNGEMKK